MPKLRKEREGKQSAARWLRTYKPRKEKAHHWSLFGGKEIKVSAESMGKKKK